MNDKVYYPEEIQDTPLPGQDMPVLPSSPFNTSGGSFSPVVMRDSLVPRKRISHETIGASLNTKSRKILQEFALTESGGLRIGKYTPGISGEIAHTPAGIIALNKGGEQTFGIDADTGDADFRGTVRAADFVVADEFGVVSQNNFQQDDYTILTTVSKLGTFSFEDVSATDILSLVCQRDTIVFVSFFANVKMNATDALRGYYIKVGVSVDGVAVTDDYAEFSIEGVEVLQGTCLSLTRQYEFSPGIHELQLQWAGFAGASDQLQILRRGMDYTMLGT